MDLEKVKSASEFIEDVGRTGNAFLSKYNPVDSSVGEEIFKGFHDLTSSEEISETSQKHSRDSSLVDVHSLHVWKLTDAYAAKVIEVNEDKITLEIVFDKETGNVQELLFDISYFEGLEISHGAFFRLNFYRRPNAQMVQFIKGHQVSDDDFPKVNLEQFTNKPLFRKKISEH